MNDHELDDRGCAERRTLTGRRNPIGVQCCSGVEKRRPCSNVTMNPLEIDDECGLQNMPDIWW